MDVPEGRRHCPNFLWGFPASAASWRLPPRSDRVGLSSCCWLLVCTRTTGTRGTYPHAGLTLLSAPAGPSFHFRKGSKSSPQERMQGKPHGPTVSTVGKGSVKIVRRVKDSERVPIAHGEKRGRVCRWPLSWGSPPGCPSQGHLPSTPGAIATDQGQTATFQEGSGAGDGLVWGQYTLANPEVGA